MNVSVGPTTRVGAAVSAILAAITAAAVLWPDLQTRLVDAGVPPSALGRATVILGCVLIAGRMLQAALGVMGREHGPGTGGVQVPDGAPADGGDLVDGEQLADPAPTVPSDVPATSVR